MTTTNQQREPGTSGFEEGPRVPRREDDDLRDQASRAIPGSQQAPQEQARPRAEDGGGRDLEVFRGLAEDAGAGLEGARMEELLTPFLGLLQPLSPQLDSGSPAYMEQAKQGMFVNTVTGQLFDGRTGLDVVPCAREYLYGEWTPRDAGGGFHGQRGPDDPEVRELLAKQGRFKKLLTPRNTELIEQFNVYAIVGPPGFAAGEGEQVVLSFTSTKMKVYKVWFNQIGHIKYPYQGRTITPAMWAHRWRLTSVRQENEKGVFWNYQIRLANGDNPRDSLVLPNDPLFEAGKDFSELVRSGRVKADYDTAAAGAGETDPDAAPF